LVVNWVGLIFFCGRSHRYQCIK